MSTITSFVQTQSAPFQFQATLDGALYTVTITWNLQGQRYFFNIYDLSGNLIVSKPLISSPINAEGQATYDINLVKGYFTISSLVYYQQNAQFVVSP
jgi:hypothetical protein